MSSTWDPGQYNRFEQHLSAYRGGLVAELGSARPFFYPFKRILLWARR